jgi:hypothetical protein
MRQIIKELYCLYIVSSSQHLAFYSRDLTETVNINHKGRKNNDHKIQAYTDEIKTRYGLGSGAALFVGTKLVSVEKYKLDNRCCNVPAEQLAITKARKV